MSKSETTYLVMGAAGDLGHRIVQALIDTKEGKRVRAGVRGGSTGKHASLARTWSTTRARRARLMLAQLVKKFRSDD